MSVVREDDQAAANALPFCLRLYAMKPRPQKPRIIMANVEGSGTAVVNVGELSVLTIGWPTLRKKLRGEHSVCERQKSKLALGSPLYALN